MSPTEGKRETAARETAASEILAELATTAERAEKTSVFVAEKTNSVTREEPGTDKKEPSVPVSAYPPLFSRIMELVVSINNSLARIENNMHRVEL